MIDQPRRTCVACREVRGKRELVRLVRLPDGTVVVDEHGKAPGRGAYVCRGAACVARLVKAGRLSQAFRRPSRAEAALMIAVQATERSETGEASSGSGVARMRNHVTSSRR